MISAPPWSRSSQVVGPVGQPDLLPQDSAVVARVGDPARGVRVELARSCGLKLDFWHSSSCSPKRLFASSLMSAGRGRSARTATGSRCTASGRGPHRPAISEAMRVGTLDSRRGRPVTLTPTSCPNPWRTRRTTRRGWARSGSTAGWSACRRAWSPVVEHRLGSSRRQHLLGRAFGFARTSGDRCPEARGCRDAQDLSPGPRPHRHHDRPWFRTVRRAVASRKGMVVVADA